jgi:hypothetical protein
MVQVHHDEGVAIHIDPESCVAAREGISEALTGERTGQPLSRERPLFPRADVVLLTEGKTYGRDIASAHGREKSDSVIVATKPTTPRRFPPPWTVEEMDAPMMNDRNEDLNQPDKGAIS